MFMQRIEVPVVETAAPRPKTLKLAVGLLFVAASLMMMPPYFLALGAWLVGAAMVKLIIGAVALAHDTVLHAGELVTGR